ncbi:hypothetical protein NLX86_06530 [Streptomyces sp. A3M-1-3]|uniref:hypothetical protein n=1 Tax=Streptomyces sp. A3M-1-3 TaxID=2962044 RepID=UPI0020B638B8|nr:hypothetical protein [Streptomyces sp. A3M-1-3]MCP3817802.1 hypothetical protein [Streptomyces sp. A3M-1-3]
MTTLFDVTPATPATRPAAGPRPLVIGLDPSLTSCGIAGADWADALRPKKLTGHERLGWILGEVVDRTKAADLVVIEGPAYGQQLQAGHHERAGLWWLITHAMHRRNIPYAVCNPHNRTIYATGKANPAQDQPREKRARIAKGMVHSFVVEQLGIWCEGSGRYDAADAAVFAAMGLDWLGYPLLAVPPEQRRALDTVHWPKTTVAVAR